MEGVAPEMFSVPVRFIQPDFEELKRRFPIHVDIGYRDNSLDPIPACEGLPRKDGEVILEYLEMGYDAPIDLVLAEITKQGKRPAFYEELLCFAEKYEAEPQKQDEPPRNKVVVALGSVARREIHGLLQRSPCLGWDASRKRCLLLWGGRVWGTNCRFLVATR